MGDMIIFPKMQEMIVNLAIHVNTKTVDADQLISQIEAICDAHGKKLQRYI